LLFLPPTPSSAIYTLSLHDALPILRERLLTGEHFIGNEGEGVLVGARIDEIGLAGRLLGGHVIRSSDDRECSGEPPAGAQALARSEEHTSELQSRFDLVCRLLLEKK